MNTATQHTTTHRSRPEAGFREASLHDLFMDCCRLGPAPTRSREVFVIAVTALLIAIVFVVMQPTAVFIATATVLVVAMMAARWVIGERTRWTDR